MNSLYVIWRAFYMLGRGIGFAGRATVALIGIGTVAAIATNYLMTQGSGTTFGSIVVGGVNYAQQFICDTTTPAQCGTVKAASAASVGGDTSIVTQENPVSPLITAVNAPLPVLAQNVEQTAVANGATAKAVSDLTGKQIMLPYANPENFLNGEITAAMTGTTSTALTGMGAQGGSFRVYVTACTFSNSHATVGTVILLQDGSGGSTLWQAPAASVFGGAHTTFPTPLKTTANNGLFAQNVTTGSNTFVSCTGYKGT
jgi:hypothetical protein